MSMGQGATEADIWVHYLASVYVTHVASATTEVCVDVCGQCCYLKACRYGPFCRCGPC